jgi:hypothetical protein
MTNPRVLGGFDTASSSPTLVITWDTGTERGAELPDKYFAEITGNFGENSLVKSAVFNPNPKNITLTFGSLSDFLTKNDVLELNLFFPDREDYIDCKHPGAPDRYQLEILLKFNQGKFVNAEFKEIANLGVH